MSEKTETRANVFGIEKQRLRDRLEALRAECSAIREQIGLDMSGVFNKIDEALVTLAQQRVIVAVFGAFSDGKSSILAALTGRLDIPIAPEPTTDRVTFYETADFLFCDMPGLFSEEDQHHARALQYVSAAHLVLFVVDAVNPLKASHHALTRWLVDEMGKEASLVFVLNKMDMVADLEDDEDFRRNACLKTEVLQETLTTVLGHAVTVPVLAVAANPSNLGITYWLEHETEYQELSRMTKLERLVVDRVRTSSEHLVLAAGVSVVRDVVLRSTEQLREMRAELEPPMAIFNNQVLEITSDLDRLSRHVADAHASIKGEILERRRALFLELDSCEQLTQVVAFLQREIGQDGHILDHSLDLVVHRHSQALGAEVTQVMQEIGRSIEAHQGLLSGLGKVMQHPAVRGALGSLQGTSAKELAHGILWLRDALSLPIRFKPWEAIKLGRFVKLLAWLGPVIEGGQLLAQWLAEHKLRQTVGEVKHQLEEGFRHFLDQFSQEGYSESFFPQLRQMGQLADRLRHQQQEYRELIGKLTEAELRLKKLVS